VSTIAVLEVPVVLAAPLVADLERRGHVVLGPAPAADADELARVLSRAELVIVGPDRDRHRARAVVDTCRAASLPLIDLSTDPAHLQWLYGEVATRPGSIVVPGAERSFVGDLLAHVAGTAVQAPREVHVAWSIGGRRLGGARSGGEGALRRLAASPAVALRDARLVIERPGEYRRLAWFPRPVGPSHAASVTSAEALSVPRHLPGVRTVGTYLAMPSWRAEVLQGLASAGRWAPVRRWIDAVGGREERPSSPPTARWACVVEVAGSDGVARAWAYGQDLDRFAAQAAAVTVAAVGALADGGGVLAPALLAEPAALLDRLSESTGLRWSVVRPTARGT
jgi:hypothetical protein